MDGSTDAADASQVKKKKPRELHPHEPEYSDVGFLSKDEMAERRLRRKELESEKSTRLSQNRIGERERLKSESQLEARRVRLRFLALTDGPRPSEPALRSCGKRACGTESACLRKTGERAPSPHSRSIS